jgi:hypothetical protein
MTVEPRQANRFVLKGDDGLEVTYDSTSFSGDARLDFRGATREKAWSGEQIRSTETPIGMLASAELEGVPDGYSILVSLLVPSVNVKDGEEEIETVLIETKIRTSIGGPQLVSGALQTYKLHSVRGTAQAVES